MMQGAYKNMADIDGLSCFELAACARSTFIGLFGFAFTRVFLLWHGWISRSGSGGVRHLTDQASSTSKGVPGITADEGDRA
jgi:hypothetical protein